MTLHGEHILYVDDDEAINFLIRRVLEKFGYRVTCTDDPTQAQWLFAQTPDAFDVVVTDLSMPGMSGFELVRAVRSVRENVPVIITSGYIRDEDQVKANDLQVNHIILKPNTIDELGEALNSLCTRLRTKH